MVWLLFLAFVNTYPPPNLTDASFLNGTVVSTPFSSEDLCEKAAAQFNAAQDPRLKTYCVPVEL